MSRKTNLLNLSGFVFPQENEKLVRDRHNKKADGDTGYESRYDFKTLFYDCFVEPDTNQVTLLGPPLFNFASLIPETRFSIDGNEVEPKIEDLSRCSVISFDSPARKPKRITFEHPEFSGEALIGAPYLEEFEGTNALYTISRNNRLEWIQDWLQFNVRNHGANAVVLADNDSDAYSDTDLAAAINEVDGIEKAVVVRAHYPFGPTQESFSAALFLQRSLAELYRRRFLGRARAVINTDIDELFYSRTGQSIFDVTANSKEGYVRADARWVYADTSSVEGFPRHRDHQFVTKSGKPKSTRKYAVVPDGKQAGRQWLTHFLGKRSDPVDPDFELWHFRQVSTGWKYDRSESADLEPYRELTDCMATSFDAPKKKGKPKKALSTKTNGRKLVITAMKNEASFIVEWVAYHRSIGFTDFLVYTNDCSDGTVELLQAMQAKGYLVHEENHVLRRGPQKSALKYAQQHPLAAEADWILVSDIDEFLNIHIGDGSVDALIDAVPNADAIPITWKLFGCSGQVAYAADPVTELYVDA